MTDIQIPEEITKTSAIASWSGFIYQGKIALYHAIELLINDEYNEDLILKLEHLDDFAIFNASNIAISIHQVKANKSKYRSGYKVALKQAANINTCHCGISTKRYFHVSVDIDDSSSYTDNMNTVSFYKYHNDKKYVSTDEIDILLKEKIEVYLGLYNMPSTDYLVGYKLASLNSLVASRVNFAHAINQKTILTQYQVADSNPILFTEISSCLNEEIINIEDKDYLLERFKHKFVSVIDESINICIDSGENESLDTIANLASCRQVIAGLNRNLIEKLYFSLDPKRKDILPEEGENDIDRYLHIIDQLPKYLYNNSIPHYLGRNYGKYLPSSLGLEGRMKDIVLVKMFKNISAIRKNNSLLDVLYEFDNLIVKLDCEEFKLMDYPKIQGKFTHNSDINDVFDNEEYLDTKHKIMKAKNIRFVSIEKVKVDLDD